MNTPVQTTFRVEEVPVDELKSGDILPWENEPGSGEIVQYRIVERVEFRADLGPAVIIHFREGEPYLAARITYENQTALWVVLRDRD